MRYKDFSVSIQVGGESLEEHGLGYEGPERNIMTCWVASQVRKVCKTLVHSSALPVLTSALF